MKKFYSVFRLFSVLGLALFMMLSFPTPSSVVETVTESVAETTVQEQVYRPQLVIRKHSRVLSNLVLTLNNLPMLFVVPLIAVRMDFDRPLFRPLISLLLRKLLLTPIKFTSKFVVIAA